LIALLNFLCLVQKPFHFLHRLRLRFDFTDFQADLATVSGVKPCPNNCAQCRPYNGREFDGEIA